MINGIILLTCPKVRKQCINYLQCTVYALLKSSYLGLISAEENFPMNLIMQLSGNIEANPGPATANCLKFC